MLRRFAIIVLLSIAATACRNDNDGQAPQTVTIQPDLAGYATIPLAAAARATKNSPTGTFSYVLVDGAIDWYVFAKNLIPSRAYRVVLTAADGKEYAVASRRTDATGTLGVHGVETALMNRQCVGAEDPSRRDLETAGTLRIALKNDGSASGTGQSDLLGSRTALPCGGNGDGNFEYVLQSPDMVRVAP